MSEKLIYKKLSEALADIKAIGKNGRNKQQGFSFRGIDDVYNNMHDIFAKHQLFTIPEVLEDRTEERQTKSGSNLIYRIFKIKYTVCTSDGSNIMGTVIGEGMDSGDKAGNKAMSIAHKYFLTQLFCIPFADMPDPDKDTYEVKAKEPQEKFNLEARITLLNKCNSMEELQKVYTDCYKIISKICGQSDIRKFTAAKDAQKEKLTQEIIEDDIPM